MAQQPIDKTKLAQEKKDLARRARRLAQTQMLDADTMRLMQFAAELDKEAEALERSTLTVLLPPTAAPHQQVQRRSGESSIQPRVPNVED